MTSEGLGEMFEGDSADTCARLFPFMSVGGERRVLRAQTREQGPHWHERKFSIYLNIYEETDLYLISHILTLNCIYGGALLGQSWPFWAYLSMSRIVFQCLGLVCPLLPCLGLSSFDFLSSFSTNSHKPRQD